MEPIVSNDQLPKFSLVLGGPLYQLWRRVHLSGNSLEFLPRRMVVSALVAWLPLLLLSFLDGHVLGGTLKIPFLNDFETHARFLVALPALIYAEVIVFTRLTPMIPRFIERHIIAPADMPRFRKAVDSALRLRNSVALELVMLGVVYTLGLWYWRSQMASGKAIWYSTPDATHLNLSYAGYWYVLVSIPLFQFILLRWYVRLVIWFRLLWQISRLKLRLTAAHPDRAGGIGFLGGISIAFSPICFAQGALLSGVIANKVLYDGRALMSFKMDAAALVCFFVLVTLGPLLMFSPQLVDEERRGKALYGLLANRYTFGFEDKWLTGAPPDTNELLGTADLQSLADLGNSYSVVQSMRWVPFGNKDILRMAAAVPLVPLGLTVFSLEELLTRLVKALF